MLATQPAFFSRVDQGHRSHFVRGRSIHWALMFCMALVASAPSAFAGITTCSTWMGQSVAIAATAQADDERTEERSLELSPEKADSFYQLLAPNSVKVLVGRRNQGVYVRGTAKEVSTLAALAEIMMRESGRDVSDSAAFIRELRATWDSNSTYNLPNPARSGLLKVLAFDDVPVLVTNQPDGIGVEATQRDQAVIADVARILQGINPKSTHKAPKQKVAHGDRDRGQKARRGGGERGERRERGHGRRGDRSGRKMAKKFQQLEERVAKLEALANQLHSGEGHDHADHSDHDHALAHGDKSKKAKAKVKAKKAEAKSKKDHAKKKKQLAKKKKGKNKKAKKNAKNPNEIITVKFNLPAHHAEHLFNLFAPADITDIIVSRSGKAVEIRATRKQHRTIRQLVKMIAPDAKIEVTKAAGNRKGKKQTG